MQLCELLKSTYEYELKRDEYGYDATFDAEPPYPVVRIDISPKGPAKASKHKVWAIEFSRGGTMTVTGHGDELRIFSTIVAIVKEFIQKEKPSAIFFSSDRDETSRMKLYDRMVKRLPGYKAIVEGEGDKDIEDFFAWHKQYFDASYKPYVLVTPDRLK
jgi:hypothetical protein